MTRAKRPAQALLVSITVALAAACEREHRDYRPVPSGSSTAGLVRLTDLQPGAPTPPADIESPYAGNAWGIAEGKRLYMQFNCVGCHSLGGGAIGPALMDGRWIYGARPGQIFSTIIQGRPNGMPSFAGRLTDQQAWQIVAYVQSMSGNVPMDALPGRSDHMSAVEPELRRDRVKPKQTGPPP